MDKSRRSIQMLMKELLEEEIIERLGLTKETRGNIWEYIMIFI